MKEHFPNIFRSLGNLRKEYTIKPKEGAVPYSLYTPRNIPISLRDKVREELNRMELARVITKVDEPTPWCAGMVVVPTLVCCGGGCFQEIGSCKDLCGLEITQSVLRKVHLIPRVNKTLAQLTGATVFSKLDVNSGFWQIPLAAESRLLTTFITPEVLYCYNQNSSRNV
jgi:hypothetical protein